MTASQMRWAASHDWYSNAETDDGIEYRVWVYSNRPEGGLCPFSNFERLQTWAGY